MSSTASGRRVAWAIHDSRPGIQTITETACGCRCRFDLCRPQPVAADLPFTARVQEFNPRLTVHRCMCIRKPRMLDVSSVTQCLCCQIIFAWTQAVDARLKMMCPRCGDRVDPNRLHFIICVVDQFGNRWQLRYHVLCWNFETSEFVIECHCGWIEVGASRFIM